MSQVGTLPNAQQLAGVWHKIKGQLREKWGDLSEDELERYKGNVEQLVGIIQERAGQGRAQVEAFLADSYEAASGMVSKATGRMSDFSSRAGEVLREQYESASSRLGQTSSDAQEFVRQRPAESLGIAFGVGFLSGIFITLLMRSR